MGNYFSANITNSIYCDNFTGIITVYCGVPSFSHYPIIIPTMKPLAEKAQEASEE